VDDGSGNSGGSFGIEVSMDTMKLTNITRYCYPALIIASGNFQLL